MSISEDSLDSQEGDKNTRKEKGESGYHNEDDPVLDMMAGMVEKGDYINDTEAMKGEHGSYNEKKEAVDVSECISNPEKYLKNNPDSALSARQIAEDIINPVDEKYIEKAISDYVKEHSKEEFVSDKNKEEILEKSRKGPMEDLAESKERIKEEYDPKAVGLLGGLFGRDEKVREEREEMIKFSENKAENDIKSDYVNKMFDQAQENAKKFYEEMDEEQKREFVIDRLAESMDKRLKDADIGVTDQTDSKGFDKYVFLSD